MLLMPIKGYSTWPTEGLHCSWTSLRFSLGSPKLTWSLQKAASIHLQVTTQSPSGDLSRDALTLCSWMTSSCMLAPAKRLERSLFYSSPVRSYLSASSCKWFCLFSKAALVSSCPQARQWLQQPSALKIASLTAGQYRLALGKPNSFTSCICFNHRHLGAFIANQP